jgi:large subunit ribosomal protein L11
MSRYSEKNRIKFSMFLRAKNVDSGPPLSTILGNYGVNTISFCKEFNEFTKELPNYFLLEVVIVINSDRSYNFSIKEPTAAFLLKLVVKKIEIFKKGSGGLKIDYIKVINLKDIYLISNFKYNSYNIICLKSICSILASSHYFII